MIGDPVNGHSVFPDRQVFLDNAKVVGMCGVRPEIFLGSVAAVKDMSEGGGGFETVDWSGREVKNLVDGGEAVEAVDHGVDLVGLNVVFNFEGDDALDDLRHGSIVSRKERERDLKR